MFFFGVLAFPLLERSSSNQAISLSLGTGTVGRQSTGHPRSYGILPSYSISTALTQRATHKMLSAMTMD
ncbi:5648_t:CDS:2 [Dentiscutata heterogama]|uniref:5648_t:CDS:1 n=1 Tax=Dentiscutata heterogama TaxID=1316150 RepID=A0ACA9LJG1_9GLOM|nr:5648_t:CDS:2 [Dentiscutata heterogama]